SDAAAANVLVQCLLGQGSLQLEGWKPSKAVTDAIALLAEEARQQLPDVALGLWPGASEAEPYDEMREAKGRCRPAYVGVVAQIEQILKQKPKRINDFKEESEKCFKGDNRLYHIPRMLTRQEADKVIAGVAQRAQALRRLVMDVNSRKEMKVGQLSCVKCGALPREVFSRIAARAGEQWTQNLVQKEGESKKLYWNMWYGPDIIRGPSENGHDFYVVEDNLGYVGGFGDLPLARSVLLGEASGSKGFPEFKPFLELENAERLYEEMAAHYKRNVAEGEKVVVLYYHRSVRDDNEDRRLVTLLRQKGLVPVQLPDEKGPREDQPRLVVRHGRVFLVERKTVKVARTGEVEGFRTATAETSEPVGLVVLLSEPTDVQPGHASTKLRSAIDEARQRIEAYEEMETKEKMKAARNEKSLVSVKSKVDFLDTEGNKSSLQMKGGKLIWTWTEKGTNQSERTQGPIRYNVATGKLTFGDYHYKPDAEGLKKLEQQWELSNLPIEAQRAHLAARELRDAVEQLSCGGLGDAKPAQNQLFRMLRADDKEGWQRLMEGKQGVPGLLEAYYKGRVKVANGPGLVLVEDKELCAYMDKLIQHYLGEEPILRTIPTRSFSTDPQLLHTVFDIPSNQSNVVVKRVDGRGGNAVWVGAKLPRNDFLAARPLVAAEPEAFIVQRYTALSKVDGQITDLRGPAFITSSDEPLSGGTGVAVSPVLWSRGVPADGSNGKVNISDAGFEFAVATAVEKPPRVSNGNREHHPQVLHAMETNATKGRCLLKRMYWKLS
ncbi:unnamed protein product, partial [Cladocopium goreaui]